MFEKGDRIKCITNKDNLIHLDLNLTYIFVEYFDENSDYLIIEYDRETAYSSYRFVLDKVYYRKQKIEKILKRERF